MSTVLIPLLCPKMWLYSLTSGTKLSIDWFVFLLVETTLVCHVRVIEGEVIPGMGYVWLGKWEGE